MSVRLTKHQIEIATKNGFDYLHENKLAMRKYDDNYWFSLVNYNSQIWVVLRNAQGFYREDYIDNENQLKTFIDNSIRDLELGKPPIQVSNDYEQEQYDITI